MCNPLKALKDLFLGKPSCGCGCGCSNGEAGKMIADLESAIGIVQANVADANKFKKIGFDNGKARLGWAKAPDFALVEKALKAFLAKAEGKETFIFVGMGGSANGVKTLIDLSGAKNIFAADSLDPAAFDAIISQVPDMKKTLIVPISKSGTTLESQLVARAFANVYGDKYAENFLWIGDPEACNNLDKLGWTAASKINIQVDSLSDIGGRFSSPQTLVFLAPLVLILGRDINKIKTLWTAFSASQADLKKKAAKEALRFKGKKDIRVFVEVKKGIVGGFANWIIQLTQESIGSKDDSLFIKTLVGAYGETRKGFDNVTMADENDPYLYVMKYMYFMQVFTAFLSYVTDVCFVDQPYVEVYKKALKSLEGKQIDAPKNVDDAGLVSMVKAIIKPEHEFIDVVLFYAASKDEMQRVNRVLAAAFPQVIVTVFIGSDWNHHSYQAAFGDKKTLFVIADRQKYADSVKIAKADADKGLATLRAINLATYQTLETKAVRCAL